MDKKKIIWIAGGSTGIGRATAIEFIKNGWTVIINARNKDNLRILKDHTLKLNLEGVLYTFECDNREKNDLARMISNIEESIGAIDIAMLNAGTTHPYSDDFNLEYYNHVVKTNILSTLNCIDAVYPFFKNRKSGHISIVSSMVGFRGLPRGSAYTMTKAALINLAESLNFDLKKIGIRVSLINPGFIKTPLTDKNTFPMPFLKSPEYAAEKIYNGLIKSKKFEIIFPYSWFIIMKTLRILPYRIYFYIVKKFTGL